MIPQDILAAQAKLREIYKQIDKLSKEIKQLEKRAEVQEALMEHG